MTDEALWALGRGTGITALLMLTVSLVLGIAGRSGRSVLGLPRFGVVAVHQFAALSASLLIAVHVTTLVIDPYAQLDLVDLVVPFGGSYEWFWVGLGTLTLDMLIVLVLTSILRHQIGQKGFRAVHWISYALWPVALAHGLGSGSDSGQVWMIAVAVIAILAVLAAVALRVRTDFTEFHRTRNVALR